MFPPPKVEVKGKSIQRQTSGQTNRHTNIRVQTGRPTGIDTTHINGLGFSRRRIQSELLWEK